MHEEFAAFQPQEFLSPHTSELRLQEKEIGKGREKERKRERKKGKTK